MVTVKRPTTPVMSPPLSSDECEAECQDSQQDAMPLRGPEELLRAIAAVDDEWRADSANSGGWPLETGKQLWNATVGTTLDAAARLQIKVKELSGKASVPQAIRVTLTRCSIKFVAVIGLTGAGKSSIIKMLTDEDVHIEHSIYTGTTTFAMFPTIIDEQRYILIDTPGFNDGVRDDAEVFEEILESFRALTPYCDLAGILYVHDITQNRFSKSAKLNLDMLEALSGEEFFKEVTILTTMWGKLTDSAVTVANKQQEAFEKGPWKTLIDGGTRVFSHRNGVAEPQGSIDEGSKGDLEEKRKLAREELEKIMSYYKTSGKVTPNIQKELRAKADIWSTKAGAVLRKSSHLPPAPNQMDSSGTTVLNSLSCRTDDSSTAPQSPPPLGGTADSGNETPTPQTQEKPAESKENAQVPLLNLRWILFLFTVVAWFLRKRPYGGF